MRLAFRAHHLGAAHQPGVVGLGLDVLLLRRRVVRRPAGAGIELGVRAEELGAAAHAAVHALVVVVPVLAAERLLGALLARHVVLHRRELLAPLGVGFLHFGHGFLLSATHVGRAANA